MDEEYKEETEQVSVSQKSVSEYKIETDLDKAKLNLLHQTILAQNSAIAEQDTKKFTLLTEELVNFDSKYLKSISQFIYDQDYFNNLISLILTIEDLDILNLSLKTLRIIILNDHDSLEQIPLNDLLPKLSEILKLDYNECSETCLSFINTLAEINEELIELTSDFVSPEMLNNFMHLFTGESRKDYFKRPHALSRQITIFLNNITKLELSVEQADFMIDICKIIIENESGGTDLAINILIKLFGKNLLTLPEFFGKEFHKSIGDLIGNAEHGEILSICNLFECLIENEWNCEDFPLELTLDAFDKNESTIARCTILDLYEKVLNVCVSSVIEDFINTNAILTVAKQIKENTNTNITGRQPYYVKKEFNILQKAADVLFILYDKMTYADIVRETNDDVVLALTTLLEYDDEKYTYGILVTTLKILKAFQSCGQLDDFLVNMYYKYDASELFIHLGQDLEDEDLIDLFNQVMDMIPE